jgi:hypothetical protein
MAISKFTIYQLTSIFITGILVLNSTFIYKQFYPTLLKLTTNKLSKVLLLNDSFILLVFLGKVKRKLTKRSSLEYFLMKSKL